MEYAFAIPGHLHVHERMPRYLYRMAMLPILPEVLVWGDVKNDPALRASTRLTPEALALERESWRNDERLKQPNPWINVPLLREVLNSENTKGFAGDSVGRAFKCLTIWQNTQNSGR